MAGTFSDSGNGARTEDLHQHLLPLSSGSADSWRTEVVPALTNAPSVVGNRSLFVKDLYLLSLSFVFVFLAYGATQNLETSVNKDQDLGSTVLGVLYLSVTFFSVGAPIVVTWLGSKNALLLGLSGYWVFIAANINPIWFVIISSSVYLGLTASVLWVAEGTYLTFLAKSHAALCNVPQDAAIGFFNGIFWGAFSFHQVIGNLFSLALLQSEQNADIDHDEASTGTRRLFIVFLGSMAIGTTLACFLRPHTESLNHVSLSPVRNSTRAMVELFHDKKLFLLILILIYTGLQQAFIWGDFTKDIVTPSLGLSWVGGVMAVYGASDTLGSFVAGKFSSGLSSIGTIVCAGASCQILVLAGLFFKDTYAKELTDYVILFGMALLWGLGDASFNTQISSLLGILYPSKTEAAFAVWKIWQCAATSFMFFVNPHMVLGAKLLLLFFMLLASLASFLSVILGNVVKF